MDSHTIFANLRDILSYLYPDESSTRIVVDDAGLDPRRIEFSSRAVNNWHAILTEAAKTNRIDHLLAVVLESYRDSPRFREIHDTYRTFVQQGGQVDPIALSAEIPGNRDTVTTYDQSEQYVGRQINIAGDVAIRRDDFVNRDKVVHGNVIENQYIYQRIAPRPVDAVVLEAAHKRLAELPLERIPEIATPTVGSRMPLSPNPLFVGREEELRKLAALLKGGETVAVGQTVATTGMGGMGKTQVAAAFAHHYGPYFQGGVFWLTMADPASIPAQIAQCGVNMPELRVDYHQLDLMVQVELVLAVWKSDLPRLLIFDNCETPELLAQWRPQVGACHVLVTSRRSRWDPTLGVQALPLHTLPRSQSIKLLHKFPANFDSLPFTTDEMAALDAIAAELGDLPLALHLAGSFLARYHHVVTPEAYLHQLQNLDSLEHRSLQSPEISPTGHEQHVAGTFALSYEQLETEDDIDSLALRMLIHIACFAPGELIPRDLLLLTLSQDNEDNDDPLDAALQAEDALHRLTELGLVEVESSGQILLHQLLALFVQSINQECYCEIQTAVEAALLSEANRLNETNTPKLLLPWQMHLRYRTNLAKLRIDETAAGLCNTLGYHLNMIGGLSEAKPYYERALAIYEEVLGGKHTSMASSLNNMGALLKAMGELSEAKPYYERALVIYKEVLGDKHPKTANSFNNMGTLLQAMGELSEAKPYIEHALVIYEEVLGDKHPKTANSFNNLGALLQAMGELFEAKPYIERALTIRQEVLGDNHPETAASLNNMGYLLDRMGKLSEAKTYYEHALVIYENVLGDKHPDTATNLNNIGHTLQMMGELSEAKPYYERALAFRREVLGDKHPKTADSFNNLGTLLQAMGELFEAKPYIERALTIRQEVLGDNHPDTAASLNNMGTLLQAMGELSKAKPHYERALAICEEVLGDNHPDTATNLNNLGVLLRAMGESAEAKTYYERALDICEKRLGSSHVFTEIIRNNLASLISQAAVQVNLKRVN